MFQCTPEFGWQRILVRSVVVGTQLLVSLAVPDFEAILNLIGGSTITALCFLFPPLMYMRLVDMAPPPGVTWKQR